MFRVALIGPDGAGKTTVGRRLERVLGLPVKYIYMGLNREASNVLLPSTRVVRAIQRKRGVRQSHGPVIPHSRRGPPRSVLRRGWSHLKLIIRTVNVLCEDCFREAVIWYYQKRGYIVLCDRHGFFDLQISAGSSHRSVLHRLRRVMLGRVFPKPDLVICLDAPSELLFARKGEGTVEALEYWRLGYSTMKEFCRRYTVVNAAQPEDDVVAEAAAHVREYADSRARRGADLV